MHLLHSNSCPPCIPTCLHFCITAPRLASPARHPTHAPPHARREFGAGCDAALRQKFAQQVTVLRTDLQKWASKQSKQVGVGVVLQGPSPALGLQRVVG